MAPNRAFLGSARGFAAQTLARLPSRQGLRSCRARLGPRYSNIRADSQRRWDFSLIKYFYLNERANFQFRAETYNALNEPVLRGPTTDPYNTAFGRVTAQEPPRSWQFALSSWLGYTCATAPSQ